MKYLSPSEPELWKHCIRRQDRQVTIANNITTHKIQFLILKNTLAWQTVDGHY